MKLVECPRDAIQGIKEFIPTHKKIEYINSLLASNLFDIIDFGSFVSPKVMPQMADTTAVFDGLDINNTKSKLLAIVINERGGIEAAEKEKISYLGFPFSISETFQQRNANSSIAESFERVKKIKSICDVNNKKLVLYISMAFGNPYGDDWNYNLVMDYIMQMVNLGISDISLADTMGQAKTKDIAELFRICALKVPEIAIGSHFHSRMDTWKSKVETAFDAGCRKFDGAILGYGGCPMANDVLVGNVPMDGMLKLFKKADSDQIELLKANFLKLI